MGWLRAALVGAMGMLALAIGAPAMADDEGVGPRYLDDFNAVQAWFSHLDPMERQTLELYLTIQGAYSGPIENGLDQNVDFNQELFWALYTTQGDDDSAPTPYQMRALMAKVQAHIQPWGLAMASNWLAGVSLTLPRTLLTRQHALPHGIEYESADETLTVQLLGIPTGEQSFRQIHDGYAEPRPGRQIDTDSYDDKSFTVSGHEVNWNFKATFIADGKTSRGFVATWTSHKSYISSVAAELGALTLSPWPGPPTDAAANARAIVAITSPPTLFEDSRTWFEGLEPDMRALVQARLMMDGFYFGPVDGKFNVEVEAGGRQVQLARGDFVNGVLTPAQLAALQSEVAQRFDAWHMQTAHDTAAGFDIMLPRFFLTEEKATAQGRQYAAADGWMTVDTMAIPVARESFAALHDRLAKVKPGEVISYQLASDDGFLIMGIGNGRKFLHAYFADGPTSRGYSAIWNGDDVEIGMIAANVAAIPILKMVPDAANTVLAALAGTSADLLVAPQALVQGSDAPEDPGMAQSRAWFEAMSLAERTELQTQLMLTGVYSGTNLSGRFDLATYNALRQVQNNARMPDDGMLTSAQSGDLEAKTALRRHAWGLEARTDRNTGITVSLARTLLTGEKPYQFGNSYEAFDGWLELDTVLAPRDTVSPATLFANFSHVEPGVRIDDKTFSEDGFTVTGTRDGLAFYVHMLAGPDSSRGIYVEWDPRYDKLGSIFARYADATLKLGPEPATTPASPQPPATSRGGWARWAPEGPARAQAPASAVSGK
ncbi:MAG TPA: peptidoglycan-binding protein [Devosiaceae bacterium]|jgi:hypothetical protein